MASACRGHRGHCEPWWTLSLHEQPLSFLWLILGLRLAMGPLGSHPVFIPMSSFSVNLFSFWGGRVGNEHLENQKAGFCLFYRPGKAERSWGSCYLGLNCHILLDLGLLVTNLDINRLGSLMHRLTFPQSFLMRWELHGTYRTSFCSWAFWELLPVLSFPWLLFFIHFGGGLVCSPPLEPRGRVHLPSTVD